MPRKTDTAEAVKETETQATAEEVKQENLMYVGPTIPGIGIQNRVYTEIPEAAKEASDSRRTLGNAEIESFTDHPARAMYSRAAELSVAVFDVVLPHSIAAASSFLYSSSVAPAVAAVEDICASNSLPTFTLATPTAPMAAPAASETLLQAVHF